jgi:hypothetical protein
MLRGFSARLGLFPDRDCKDASDDRKGKFQMKIDGECSDIPESVPDCTANGQVDWLDLYGEAESVQRVDFRKIGLCDSQGAGDISLAGYRMGERQPST